MKIVRIDPTICICCGTCIAMADALFEMDSMNGVAKVISPTGELTTPEDEELAQECADMCPAMAISVEEK